MADSTHDSVAEVDELYRDQRVTHVVPFLYLVFYQADGLGHCQAFHMQGAQNREVDVPVHVHAVAFFSRSHVGVGAYVPVSPDTESAIVDIERYGQFRVLVAHCDAESVVPHDHGLVLEVHRVLLPGLHVLEIDEILCCGARCEKQGDAQKEECQLISHGIV